MTVDRTVFASEAFTFADRFHTCFAGRQVEGYKLFLTTPEGESTGGGVQAVQHITLQDETHKRTMVLGSARGPEKKAELRSYGSIVRVFTKRFPGVAFPMPLEDFDALQQSFIKFFEMLKFDVEIETAQKKAKPPVESPRSPSPRPASPSPSPRPASPSPSPRPSPRPASPAYARGASHARKAPPPFSLREFLEGLPTWVYIASGLLMLLVACGIFLLT